VRDLLVLGASPVGPAGEDAGRLVGVWRPIRRLSRTVIPLKRAMFWNVRAIPRRVRADGTSPVISFPS
jgi:hypothetical protein